MALNSIIRKGLISHLKKTGQFQQVAWSSDALTVPQISAIKIGKREVVGYGINSQPNYIDSIDFPMPAVRFREPTPEIQVIIVHFL